MATAISAFTNLVAPDVLTCPQPIIDREVVSALLDFCAKSHILQTEFQVDISALTVSATTQNLMIVNIASYIPSLRPVTLLGLMVDSTYYIPRYREIQNTITNWAAIKDDKYKYFILKDADTEFHLYLYDMSENNNTLWVKMSLKPVRDATSIADESIYEDWSDAIVAGAKSKILMMPGKEWTDTAAAQIYQQEYRRYLSEAKAAALRGRSAESQSINWKSFGEID